MGVELKKRRELFNQDGSFPKLKTCPCMTKEDVCEFYGDIGSNVCVRDGGTCEAYNQWAKE
jgi:hypothetical protein